MSIITRCDFCGYEKNSNNPVFGYTGRDWQQLHKNGFVYDLCTFKCVSEFLNNDMQTKGESK